MPRSQILILTLLAMLAFAGNSLLCRLGLKDTGIDAASFTSVRVLAGAITLGLLVRIRGGTVRSAGSWLSALALFAYAAAFSFAYLSLPVATGALLLFGAVQATMIGYGLFTGERLRNWQVIGLLCACGGLAGLLFPGFSAPPLYGSILMLGAGVAWGAYSLRGRGAGDPLSVTAGNFLRAVPFALALGIALLPRHSLDPIGLSYAIASGALTSGVGYAIWYTAVRGLSATSAATVQLSVPVITAIGGILFLDETISLRLLVASVAILGGIALVVFHERAAG